MLDDKQCQLEFGKFIREGRESHHLYQSDVAHELEVSQQYYSQIENGTRNVDFVMALKICKTLNLDLNQFIRTYL